jgi:hypothetical protein
MAAIKPVAMQKKFMHLAGGMGKLFPPESAFACNNRIFQLVCLFFVGIIMTANMLDAQDKKLSYKIIQGGNEVGYLSLLKKDSAGVTKLNMESSAQKRIIFLISIYEKQTCLFKNGTVTFSNVYRKVNGSVKTNKSLLNNGNGYEVCCNGKKEKINLANIHYNQLSLYYEEPVHYNQIYSDQFECMLNIEKLKSNNYKIQLPDGNTNYYTYTNGILSSIKLKHTFFSAEFILTHSE